MKPNSNCRSCGAPVRWCVTDVNRKRMPVDPTPVADGNVWIMRMEQGTPIIGVALHGSAVPVSEALRYVSHFVSCPDSDSWRKS